MESRSKVWDGFEKLAKRKKAKCKFCSRELAWAGGTTNLKNHLERAHPAEWRKISTPSTGAQTSSSRRLGSIDAHVRRTSYSVSRAEA